MKKLILPALLLALIGGFVGYKMYNKPHQEMTSAKADITLAANQLFSEYESDESGANTKYLDKVVQVSGKVLEAAPDKEGIVSVTLDGGGMLGGVICKLDQLTKHKRDNFKAGETVTFKGKCTGMLMDVVLVRCVEI